jgi:hypothetical protein
MAPEQARGKQGGLDHRCDLFSLGCVLYRMTTGHEPFRRDDTMATLLAVALDEPEAATRLNPEIPPAVERLIAALLAKEPAARPPSALAVVERLTAAEVELGAAPPPAVRPGPPEEPLPWADEAAAPPASPTPWVETGEFRSITDTPVMASSKTERVLAKLAAREAENRDANVCPGCGGSVALGWCVSCGYMAGAPIHPLEQETAPPLDLKWIRGLLLGVLAVVVFSGLVGLQFPADSMSRVWWGVGEACTGLLVLIAAHVWVFVISRPDRAHSRTYQYFDPFELWYYTFYLLPKTQQPICVGSWGATGVLCGFLFIGILADWEGIDRKRAARRAVPAPGPVQPRPPVPPEPVEPTPAPEISQPIASYPVQEPEPRRAAVELSFGAPGSARSAPAAEERFTATCHVIGYNLAPDGKSITGLVLGTKVAGQWQVVGTIAPDADSVPRTLYQRLNAPDFRRLLDRLASTESVVEDAKLPGTHHIRPDDAFRCEVDYTEVGPDGQFAEPRIKAFRKSTP